MADIKWIKITTDIFDDEKIKIIDTMPARDEILVVWFKLLSLAGKVNQNGLLFMNNKIAYTPNMLAAIFNRELGIIQLSLSTFEQFGMITVEDNEVISIANWEKHQNIDGMDKIREQNRIRQQRHREKQLQLTSNNVTNNVTVTEDNAIDKDKDKDKSSISEDVAKLFKFYEQEIGLASPTILIDLNTWLEHFDEDIIEEAIKRASMANARNYNYVKSVLTNWLNEGVSCFADTQKGKKKKGKVQKVESKGAYID